MEDSRYIPIYNITYKNKYTGDITMDDLYEKVLILENKLRLKDKKIAELLDENDELKEDNDRLQGLYQDEHCEVLRLTEELNQLKKYKYLFEKAKEMKTKTDKWARKCLEENEELKNMLKRTVCQSECYKHKLAELYKGALEQVNDYIESDIPIKVIQDHGNIPMIYYADFQNEIKNPILNLIKEVL